jgi:putative addiction module component (TIGR02574 family)
VSTLNHGQWNPAELLHQAVELSADERRALAAELLNSVEGPEDQHWSEAWAQELDRRSAAGNRREEALAPWATVESRIRADLPHQHNVEENDAKARDRSDSVRLEHSNAREVSREGKAILRIGASRSQDCRNVGGPDALRKIVGTPAKSIR